MMSSSALFADFQRPVLVIAAIVLLYVCVRVWLYYQKSCCKPRGFSRAKFVSTRVERLEGQEIHRDNYTKKKVPQDIDVIVIGRNSTPTLTPS